MLLGGPAKPLTDDTQLMTLQEFISFWKGGRLRVRVKGKVRVVPYFQEAARVLRRLMSMMGHFDLTTNPEMEAAIRASRKHAKLSLQDWKVLLYVIKLQGGPKRSEPISLFSSPAVEEVKERYVAAISEASRVS